MPVPRRATAARWASLALALGAAAVVGAGTAGGAPAVAPVAAPAAAATPAAAGTAASPALESQFVARINSLRAGQGLRQLTVSGELTGVARRWTDQMVAAGQISHNPNLGSQVGGAWTKLGENVGVGYDVDGLMQAFINSPSHYRNLVDPEWTHVGVGVRVLPDGTIYTTHNFMALPGGSPPPPPPPPPPTTAPSQPPAGTTPTTAPPATEPTTTTTEPPRPEPTPERVAAVLDPLRSLEE